MASSTASAGSLSYDHSQKEPKGEKIIAAPGEQTAWEHSEGLMPRHSVPNPDATNATVIASPRPLALNPLPVPKTPPKSEVHFRTLYSLGVSSVLAELKTLAVEPRVIVSPDHPAWFAAKLALERAGEKATDWAILTEIVHGLNERFEVAAQAARRRLYPPPAGYLARGHEWLRKQYGDIVGTEPSMEEETLTAIEGDYFVRLLLREMKMASSADIAVRLREQSVEGVIEVCNALWQLYTIECGSESAIKVYNQAFQSQAPSWFLDLQSNMHLFYRSSTEMMDSDDYIDGSQADPLPSPQSRGFTQNGVGFLVDARSIESIEEANGVVAPVSFQPPSIKSSTEQAEEAERLHPRWAYLTHLAGGNAFFQRDTYEFDYQTAVVVTRSPAGAFRHLRERGYLYAVGVPESGVDLEAAQRYIAAVVGDESKISRAGEKAYPRILYEDLLAYIAVETAGVDAAEYPTFYRYAGDWEYTRFAQNPAIRDYISSALPPPILPIPMGVYEEFFDSFMQAQFKGDFIHVGAIAGVPVHVWNDFRAIGHYPNVSEEEHKSLKENPLLAVHPKYTAAYREVQNNPVLWAESQRRTFVAAIEREAEADPLTRLEHLTQYPERFLGADQLLNAKILLEHLLNVKGSLSLEELNDAWESVCGPRIQVDADSFHVTPSFTNSTLSSKNIERKYYRTINRLMDPKRERSFEVHQDGTVMRWPVSPVPRGFRNTQTAFFVADPNDFKDGMLFPEFSSNGRFSAVWKSLGIQTTNDFIWNHQGTSLIPETCILISRTFEGAIMTAKPNNVLTYNSEKSTAERVYAVRLDRHEKAFDLERFQRDEIAVPRTDLASDARPGVKALGMRSFIKQSDIIASIPVQRLDMAAPPKFQSVISFGAGVSSPKRLPVLFQCRLLQSSWDMAEGAKEDDVAYLDAALAHTWTASVPSVDGRVHSQRGTDTNVPTRTAQVTEASRTTQVTETSRISQVTQASTPSSDSDTP